MPVLGDYLTKAELAEAINRCEKTVDRYTDAANGLPYVLVGRQKLFREDWTREWLEQHRRQNNPTTPRRGRSRRRQSAEGRAGSPP